MPEHLGNRLPPAGGQPTEIEPDPVDILDTPEAGGRVICGGALMSATYVVSLLLTAASVPVMIRALGVDDFGLYVTASSAVMIIAGVTEAGLNGIGTREYVAADGAARHRIQANLLGMRITLTVAGLAIGCGVMAALGYSGVIVAGTAIAGLGLLLTITQENWTIPLAGGLQWGWVSMLGVARAAVTAGLVVGIALVDGGVMAYFWISVAAGATVLGITGWKMRHALNWPPAADRPEWWRLMRDAIPYALATTVGILYFRIALMMLALVSTKAESGYYSAAFKIVELVGGFSGLIVGVAFPVLARAARDDLERLRYGLTKVLQTTVMVGSWFSLCIFVGAPLAIDLLAGPEFAPAVDVLRLQAVTLVAGFAVSALAYALLSLRQHAALLRASCVALVVSVILSLVLIPGNGAEGAAIATVVAEATLMLGYYVELARHQRDLRPSPLIWMRVLAALAPAVAVGLLVPVPDAVAVVLASIVYFGVLWAVRGIPEELWTALREALPGRGAAAGA